VDLKSSFLSVSKFSGQTLCLLTIEVPAVARAIADVLEETKAFITNQLQLVHQREDY